MSTRVAGAVIARLIPYGCDPWASVRTPTNISARRGCVNTRFPSNARLRLSLGSLLERGLLTLTSISFSSPTLFVTTATAITGKPPTLMSHDTAASSVWSLVPRPFSPS